MKRVFFLAAAGIIGAAGLLTIAGWWHELVQADKRATGYLREHHPGVAGAAKRIGDAAREISRQPKRNPEDR